MGKLITDYGPFPKAEELKARINAYTTRDLLTMTIPGIPRWQRAVSIGAVLNVHPSTVSAWYSEPKRSVSHPYRMVLGLYTGIIGLNDLEDALHEWTPQHNDTASGGRQ